MYWYSKTASTIRCVLEIPAREEMFCARLMNYRGSLGCVLMDALTQRENDLRYLNILIAGERRMVHRQRQRFRLEMGSMPISVQLAKRLQPSTGELPWSPLRAPGDYRYSLLSGGLGEVEDSSVSADRAPPSGYSPEFQIVLPYLGLFGWRTRRDRLTLIDANKNLFVTGGQEFEDTHPVRGVGHASVIITPRPEVLDEICGGGGASRHTAFRDVERPATARTRLLTHRLLGLSEHADPLAGDELAVRALRQSLSAPTIIRSTPSRLVDAAKQYLHGRGFERVTLSEMAREIGVSPVYLTQAFSRAEGVPLYRYQLRIRLSRSLLELPHCSDLTALALELGFSSHSHFSAAFRQMFGMTPAGYRAGAPASHFSA